MSLKDVVCVDGAGMDKENDDNLKKKEEPLKSGLKETTANDVESPLQKVDKDGTDVETDGAGRVVQSVKSAKWKARKRKKTARKAKPIQTSTLNAIDHAISVELDFDTKTSTWKCDICQSSFARSDELNSHLDSHSDLKHFRCEICGTRFTKKSVIGWMEGRETPWRLGCVKNARFYLQAQSDLPYEDRARREETIQMRRLRESFHERTRLEKTFQYSRFNPVCLIG